jgi:hypothetical protein
MGWITTLAKVAAEPPQAKGSIFLAKALVVGFSSAVILIFSNYNKKVWNSKTIPFNFCEPVVVVAGTSCFVHALVAKFLSFRIFSPSPHPSAFVVYLLFACW